MVLGGGGYGVGTDSNIQITTYFSDELSSHRPILNNLLQAKASMLGWLCTWLLHRVINASFCSISHTFFNFWGYWIAFQLGRLGLIFQLAYFTFLLVSCKVCTNSIYFLKVKLQMRACSKNFWRSRFANTLTCTVEWTCGAPGWLFKVTLHSFCIW